MKHHLLRTIILFLLAVPILHAEMQQKKIIVSSSTTPIKAQKVLKKLQEYISAYPDIVTLLQENNIALTSRPSGNYHIVVIEPFSDKETLIKVTELLKKRYSGIFVNRYIPPTPTQMTSAVADTAVAASKIEADVPLDEISKSADRTEILESEKVPVKAVESDTVIATETVVVATETVIEKENSIETATVQDEVLHEAEIETSNVETTISETISEPAIDIVEAVTVEIASEPVIEPTVADKAHKSTTIVEKESFINHEPIVKKENNHSALPPWWVLLSFLVLILSPIDSYIEARNKKYYY